MIKMAGNAIEITVVDKYPKWNMLVNRIVPMKKKKRPESKKQKEDSYPLIH